MKLFRTSVRLLAALLSLAALSPAANILASGVGLDSDGKLTDTSLFFDMGKGSYGWNTTSGIASKYQNALNAAKTLWTQEGKYDFLGELETRVPETVQNAGAFSNDAFSEMQADTLLCWGYTASNMLQYWQSTYGVFYQGTTSALPHGYTYDKQYHETLAGTMSLDVGMTFYDNWNDAGGYISKGLSWYLTGNSSLGGKDGAVLKTDNAGGYFKQYAFSSINGNGSCVDQCGTLYVNDKGTIETMESDLLATYLGQMLGYTRDTETGEFTRVLDGHLASMSVYWDGGDGHALTVYGFSTDDKGRIVSLKIADSDDGAYGVYDLYLKEGTMTYTSNGVNTELSVYKLYTDAGCTKAYNGGARIGEFYGISWSQELSTMRYHYDNDMLVWSGKADTWVNAPKGAETEFLPDATSGWAVLVKDYASENYITDTNEGYYDSFFYSGRMAGFDDSAQSTDVVLGEDVAVSAMEIANDDKSYTFSGGHRIEAEQVLKHGTNTATLKNVELKVRDKVTVQDKGALQLDEGATLKMGAEESTAYTLARRGEEGVGSLARAELTPISITGTDGLGEMGNVTLTVAEGGFLALKDVTLDADSLICGLGDIGAQVELFNVTIVLGEDNVKRTTLTEISVVGPSLTGALTAQMPEESIVLEINNFDNLELRGESLTLDLSKLSDETKSSLLEAGDVQLTFAGLGGDSLANVSDIGVTLDGQGRARVTGSGESSGGEGSGVSFVFRAGEALAPEPATVTLGLLGLVALAGRRRRR